MYKLPVIPIYTLIYFQWYYDPLQIPNLTASLTSNLIRCAPRGTSSSFTRRFENLPPELRNKIANLIPGQLPAASCNYLMPQAYWKRVFLQIPFLWDVDAEAIARRSSEADTTGFEWDWEKLTRQVMTPAEIQPFYGNEVTVGFYEKKGLSVPPGLGNRRRIWQILEEMYPNDVGLDTST